MRKFFPISGKLYEFVRNTVAFFTLSIFIVEGGINSYNIIKEVYSTPSLFHQEKVKKGKNHHSLYTYNDLFNYLGDLTGLGDVLKAIAFAESSFNANARSHSNAYGVMQVKRIAYEEVKRIYNLSKNKLNTYGVENIYACHPSDLTTFMSILKINKEVSVKEEKDVRYVYAPFFLLTKHLYPYGFPEWKRVKNNPLDNAKIGTLYFYYLYLTYGHLQAIKTGKKIKYIRRDPPYFNSDKEKYRLFPPEKLWLLYNLGPAKLKEFERKGISTLYTLVKHLPAETKTGLRNIQRYLQDSEKYTQLLNQPIFSCSYSGSS